MTRTDEELDVQIDGITQSDAKIASYARTTYSRGTFTTLATGDATFLQQARVNYGHSWKRRGGVGAFMMLARKWDRLEVAIKSHGNIPVAYHNDARDEGVIDDIRDLRRYLVLVETECYWDPPADTFLGSGILDGLASETICHVLRYRWACLELAAKLAGYDIFQFQTADGSQLRDFRRFLYVMEAMLVNGD